MMKCVVQTSLKSLRVPGVLVGGFLISYTINWVVGFLLPFLWPIFPTYPVPSHFIWLNDNGLFLGDFSQFGSSMTVTFIYFDCHKKIIIYFLPLKPTEYRKYKR